MQHPCSFCNISTPNSEIIQMGNEFISLVSVPWFREGHCLVIPKRHIENVSELMPNECREVLTELGRLSKLLDNGWGTGIMQKFQPRQSENGIKVNHLHFHVFPRYENDDSLFPTPIPNSFDGFHTPSSTKVQRLTQSLSVSV